jgi:hypothetical protein
VQATKVKTMTARQRVLLPESLVAAVSNRDKVTGAPHDFYRYPARFSPVFAREAVKTFTERGDFVLDPFAAEAQHWSKPFRLEDVPLAWM